MNKHSTSLEEARSEIRALRRELEIEASLEKIRTRTMAMEKSDELAEVSYLLNKQVVELGIPTRGCVFHIYNEHDSTEWLSNLEVTLPTYKTPRENIFLKYYEAGQRGETLWIEEFGGERIKEHYKYLFSLIDPDKGDETVDKVNAAIPDFQIDHVAYFKYGYLLFITLVPAPEAHEVFKRLAKEFEQTYTRFLDLQKAEAQAREAQIEAALERVRSRSMAMHHTAELQDVIKTVHDQLSSLHIDISGGVFIAINEDTKREISCWGAGHTADYLELVHIPFLNRPIYSDFLKVVQQGPGLYTQAYSYEEKMELFQHLLSIPPYSQASADHKKEVLARQGGYIRSVVVSKHASIFMINHNGRVFTSEEDHILLRFSNVFEQSYTRFLDLQKAEAQAREAQIEAALERVRARTMGMRLSSDLHEVIKVVMEQLLGLGLRFNVTNFARIHSDGSWDLWLFTPDQPYPAQLYVPYLDHPIFNRVLENIQAGADFSSDVYDKGEKDVFFRHFFEKTLAKNTPEERKNFVYSTKGFARSLFLTQDIWFAVVVYDCTPFTDEENAVLRRFAGVFEQTYTRFLDLQKAEAQAREAQIEAALEKVRSRSLAMHHSSELQQVVGSLFDRLVELGLSFDGAGIFVFDKKKRNIDLWIATTHLAAPALIDLPIEKEIENNGLWKDLWQAFENGNDVFHRNYSGEVKNEYFRYVAKYNEIPEPIKQIHQEKDWLANFVASKYALIGFDSWSGHIVKEEDFKILKRFATVFDQSYTRFVDLQKTEAQAREAQIEAALERVRAQTMAMHNSDDIGKCIVKMFAELTTLGVDEGTRFGIGILNHENENIQLWTASKDGEEVNMHIGNLDMTWHPLLKSARKAWKEQLPLHTYVLEGEDLVNYYQMINNAPDYKFRVTIEKLPAREFHYGFVFDHGFFYAFSHREFQPELIRITQRFSSLFGQTYRRYLDLVRAEAQAHEAQVEAALERVRAKAMAMHSSQDLADTIGTFYTQLKLFNLVPRRCGVGLLNKHNKEAEVFTWNTTENGESLELVGKIRMDSHPVLENVYNSWITQTEYHPVLRGNEIREYYQVIRPQVAFPEYQNEEVHYGYFFMFEEGGVYAWKETPLKEDELTIYRRFTSVLSLTYKRYKDLKEAEVRAKEAVKQATLDRVRAEIASMRTVSDLDRITPLIWRELTTLGIPFVRCGVFIMDDSLRQIHTFLSTPDGHAIAAFHLPYDAPGRTSEILSNWMNNKEYIEHWDETAFGELGDLLVQQGALPSKDVYLQTIPQGGIHLHCLPFLQGMLYVGNTEKLRADDIQLIQSVADAFSTAYARYEDFNRLEAAKQQVDKALVELKQAQQQLVQSEKMASLGELTAGIAHEIQNPLNFVNNFSEVNQELLTEMQDEIEKGNFGEVKAIAKDLTENEKKITYHGRRADSIVKGMLQHSRTSTGQREPTDINALADEYLRLSYHGLRARDKTFNADFKTDFDPSLTKINVIPQDIGRVLLNLINNAFYAVDEKVKSEKQKAESLNYQPNVLVSTKKSGDEILISVRDNGNGISESVKDKIFQPFFTTKPPGQGTGLGLSLSYDIVKAHGGELKVETKEGEGSKFVISIPIV
jgi:signal transduction histidine kinase